MANNNLLAKVRLRVARWIAPDIHTELGLTRIDELQRELAQLRAGLSVREGLETDFKQIQQELDGLKALAYDSSAAQMAAKRKASIEQTATFADSAILSDEGLIENTHGDRNAIRVGKHSYVRGRLLTYGHGGNISIGEWVYVGARTEIWSMESISIGDRVLISHDVNIHDGTAHSSNASERHEHFKEIILKGHPTTKEGVPGVKSAPVIIEDDAWISFGVSILRGVTIGAGSVIAAGSIVTKDVPPGVLYQCEVTPIIKELPKDFQRPKSAQALV